MLYTNLKHIENTADWQTVLSRHRKVVVVCGRMDPESVRLYRLVESLEKFYRSVHFFDIEADHPELQEVCRSLSSGKMLPFIFILRDGELKQVVSEVATADQLKQILKEEFDRNNNLK